MKCLLKLSIITIFVVILCWQIIGFANKPGFDFDKQVKCVERVEASLDKMESAADILNKQKPLNPSLNYPEAKLLLMSNNKPEANIVLNKIIEEYEEIINDPSSRQKALEEITVLTYYMEEYEKAFLKAQEVLKEYPKDLPASTVLGMYFNRKAVEYAKKREYGLAIGEYQKILDYPVAAGPGAFADYFTGRMYEEKRDKQTADIYYNNIINEYPELPWAEHAKERIETKK